MKEKMIVWEKWIDPLNSNIDEVEYPGYLESNEDKNYEFLSTDPEFESKIDSDYDDERLDSEKSIIYNPTRIVSTPHGFVSLTEHSFASKHFDFWTLHYNRDITEKIIEEVEKCEGVETVNAISRYRIRIGFNRILNQAGGFNLTDSKRAIEKTVINGGAVQKSASQKKYNEKIFLLPESVQDEVIKIIDTKFTDATGWMIYVLPNGKIDYLDLSSDNQDLVLEKAILFSETKRLVGGDIIESD
tara:strand:- start:5253 stop:5984 length:732 start_codon:yes stop_codon:yes gene_type:complete